MQSVSLQIVRHAHQLAHEVKARAILLYADTIAGDEELRRLLKAVNFPTILVTRSQGAEPAPWDGCTQVAVPKVPMTRAGQVKMAVLGCLAKGLLREGDRVVCLTGVDSVRGAGPIDALLVLDLGAEPELLSLCRALGQGEQTVSPAVFERALALATQLAVEGREGRPVGLTFVLGDSATVLAQSRGLVLNPFRGYPETERNILDPALEETVKEYSALDGAFVVRGDGVLLSAGVQLLPAGDPAPLPRGLGTRHAAAAGITASTRAMAVVVSQSTGALTVFKAGRLVTDIHRPASGARLAL
jgi:DNA integrity scanning protein DisA with diadenylate cyclase activity